MIRSFCLVAFNAAMENAGKTPPDGMGDYTCSCFMDRLGAPELKNPVPNARRKQHDVSLFDVGQPMLTGCPALLLIRLLRSTTASNLSRMVVRPVIDICFGVWF